MLEFLKKYGDITTLKEAQKTPMERFMDKYGAGIEIQEPPTFTAPTLKMPEEEPEKKDGMQEFLTKYAPDKIKEPKARQKGLVEMAFGKRVDESVYQFSHHLLNNLGFGLPDLMLKAIPESTWRSLGEEKEYIFRKPQYPEAQVAAGVGELIGFIKSPLKLAGKITAKIPAFTKPMKGIKAVTQFIGKGMAELGIASTIVEHKGLAEGKPIENLAARLKALESGAVMGAAFGGASFIKFAKLPITSGILRMGTGMALMDVMQGTKPWDDRTLIEKTFNYGLAAWMTRKGMTARDFLDSSSARYGEAQALKKEIVELEAKARKEGIDLKLKTPEEALEKPEIPGVEPEVPGKEIAEPIKGLTAEQNVAVERTTDTVDEVLPLRERLNRVTDNVVSGKTSLQKPGQPIYVAKYKKGGTTPVTIEETKQLMDRAVPDLQLGAVSYAIKPMIFIARKFKPFKKLLDDYHIKDTSSIREYRHDKETILKPWKQSLLKAGLDPKASAKRMTQYLTGLQKDGEQILKATGYRVLKASEMHSAELKIIGELRPLFDKLFTRVNRARKQAGQKELKYEQNYLTWIRNLTKLKDVGISLGDSYSDTVDAKLSAPYLPEAIPRKRMMGKVSKIPIEMDFFKIVDTYLHDTLKSIHMTPVIAKGRAYLEPFRVLSGEYTKAGKPKTTEWSLKMDKPHFAESMHNWLNAIAGKGEWSKKAWAATLQRKASKLNRNLAVAILSWNVRSAAIQGSALRGAYVETGAYPILKGIHDLSNPVIRARLIKESGIDTRNMDIHVARFLEQTVRGKFGAKRQMVGEIGLKPLQYLDAITAEVTYAAGKRYALDNLKLEGRDAVTWAKDLVVKTQASGKIGDLAEIQRSAQGRLLTIFQTFTITEWNWIMEDILGIQNPQVNFTQNLSKAVRFVIATSIVNAVFEEGLHLTSPFPSPEFALIDGIRQGKDTKDIIWGMVREMGEQVPVVGGTIRWSTDYRTAAPAAIQLGADAWRALSKIGSGRLDKLTLFDGETLFKAAGVPGTSQARKTVSRLKKGMTILESVVGVKAPPPVKKTVLEKWKGTKKAERGKLWKKLSLDEKRTLLRQLSPAMKKDLLQHQREWSR